MDARTTDLDAAPSHEVIEPVQQTVPLVFASPHSGSRYPAQFIAASRLDPLSLRSSEDSFVDEIFAAAPQEGAPLLRALFPRAFVDPNREPFELDPSMFREGLPPYANTKSPRVAAGLGTIARVVANGAEIYREKLLLDEALDRIHRFYWPYHDALRDLVERTKAKFGFCILVDCHSMPSAESSHIMGPGKQVAPIVLGDCYGSSCAGAITKTAEHCLDRLGYGVARNVPYAGGFVTRHYGRPREGCHVLQIEINRRLYMDESRMERKAHLAGLSDDMRHLIRTLGRLTAHDVAEADRRGRSKP